MLLNFKTWLEFDSLDSKVVSDFPQKAALDNWAKEKLMWNSTVPPREFCG